MIPEWVRPWRWRAILAERRAQREEAARTLLRAGRSTVLPPAYPGHRWYER